MKRYFLIPLVVVGLLLTYVKSSSNNGQAYLTDVTFRLLTGGNVFAPIDTPQSFVKNYNGVNNPLFVFVGKKISVEPLPTERLSMDACFKARYSVLQSVYGQFSEDTIEFVVYDHYGTPAFSSYETVLLYVSADSGTYYHQKYTFNDVYQTKDGRWAGPYDLKSYGHSNNSKTMIKPVLIDFEKEVRFPVTDMEKGWRKYFFPKPYFKVINDTAIAVYGNYVEELFQLNRDGVLTARKLF